MKGKGMVLMAFPVIFLLGAFSLAEAALSGPLAQIIEGAKKEGEVAVTLRSSFTPRSMERLEKAIKEQYGVDLKIKYTPSASMSKAMSQIMMEYKVGAAPSHDLMNFSNHIIDGMKAGVFERVDWKPLMTNDTNLDAVPSHPAFHGAVAYYTSHQGLMYNSQKVPVDTVPKTMREMADPKWKGKIGISIAPSTWAMRAFILGKEKVLSDLRAILKNGALRGQYSDLQNRYLLGEIWMAYSITSYMKSANDKDVPTAWQSLDYSDVPSYFLVVTKGAKHPNAAKLVAVYLASPRGVNFTLEESGSGNLYYPGNFENDIRIQNKKQGVREVILEKNPALVDFFTSKDFKNWSKEIKLIMDTEGER